MALGACRTLRAFPPSISSQIRSLLLAPSSVPIPLHRALLPDLAATKSTATTTRASSSSSSSSSSSASASTSASSTAPSPAPLSLATVLDDDRGEIDYQRKSVKKPQGVTTRDRRPANLGRQADLSVDVKSFPFAEKTFAALKLSPGVLRRLAEEGLSTPTDVQVSAIPVVLEGYDAAIQSYTGSGKTLAYLLPILSKVGPLGNGWTASDNSVNRGGVQVLIVVPSRELAMQIVREAEEILGLQNRRLIQQLIGGANPQRQEEGLKKNKPLIVVGTPGRISELSRAGKLHTHACQFLVLDEADQLLSSKFRVDMRRILEHVGQRRSAERQAGNPSSLVGEFSDRNSEESSVSAAADASNAAQIREKSNKTERQTILVSATMPTAVLRAAVSWGHRPRLVRVTSVVDVEESPGDSLQEGGSAVELRGVRESLPPNLEHFYVTCPIHHRVDTLRKCIHALEAQSVLVFMNHSRRLKDTEFKLTARGIAASTLSGELNKLERANVLAAFRSGRLRVLVASEVGARGLDVPACDLVVNLELPTDGSHYAHRGGRSGRLGRRGTVVSICEGSEEFVLQKFERQLGVKIVEADLSNGKLIPRG